MVDADSLANIFGCRVALLPMKYSGLPLRASYKSTCIWSSVVEKLERRMADWKRLYLSKGGRLTLIKSTFSNLPTYYLSLFPILIVVAKKLENLTSSFMGRYK